jgi:hypothetical protein
MLLAAAPISARTICREDGYCYNTSGKPVYQQPEWRRHDREGYHHEHEGYYQKHRHDHDG